MFTYDKVNEKLQMTKKTSFPNFFHKVGDEELMKSTL